MKTGDKSSPRAVSYQCPICGKTLPSELALPRFDAPCSECGYHVWCRRVTSSGEVVLDVLPERTPELSEVEQLVEALVRSQVAGRVIVDLSRLDSIDSRLTARLVSMNKLLRASGRSLVLRGLAPIVREIICHFRLEGVLEIADPEEQETKTA